MSVCVTLGLASGYGSSQGLVSLLCVCVQANGSTAADVCVCRVSVFV
jgi:hypothetical protein